MQQTDEQLAILVKGGDLQSFAVLMERYEHKIKRYGRKFLRDKSEIEDVVQEVFLKAYINIQGFDVKQKFSSWLYRIAHNEFINVLKKNSREPIPFFDIDTIFPHPVARESPEQDLDKQEMRDLINQCLEKLDVKYREVLILYYFEELDYKEISDVLRVPVSTVGVRLSRGREKIVEIAKKLRLTS